MSDERTRHAPWATGLSVTGVAALFVVLRLFAVARYDWHTAFSVADTIQLDDAPTVVIGTLMADRWVSGGVLVVLLPLVVIHQVRLGRPSRENAGHLGWLLIVAVYAVALVWTYRLWWVPAGAAAVGAALTALLAMRRRDRGGQLADWLVRRVGVVTVLAALVVAATVHTPWTPLERITTTTTGPVEGYVLDTTPGFLKVLLRDEHDFVIVDTADVTSRTECEHAC